MIPSPSELPELLRDLIAGAVYASLPDPIEAEDHADSPELNNAVSAAQAQYEEKRRSKIMEYLRNTEPLTK